jgi:hypothetical protein
VPGCVALSIAALEFTIAVVTDPTIDWSSVTWATVFSTARTFQPMFVRFITWVFSPSNILARISYGLHGMVSLHYTTLYWAGETYEYPDIGDLVGRVALVMFVWWLRTILDLVSDGHFVLGGG